MLRKKKFQKCRIIKILKFILIWLKFVNSNYLHQLARYCYQKKSWHFTVGNYFGVVVSKLQTQYNQVELNCIIIVITTLNASNFQSQNCTISNFHDCSKNIVTTLLTAQYKQKCSGDVIIKCSTKKHICYLGLLNIAMCKNQPILSSTCPKLQLIYNCSLSKTEVYKCFAFEILSRIWKKQRFCKG
eukprot:TRINITY_DN38630_c0_g1_i2.p1 TRINITY_DN38630_c0_g1~~TRINITY_DN38630_c0_g1_i2.p1  ORF type:complete len:186 (+),score=-14.86 TRINITY_DN38630_c0_g1_i2:67-624(+)